MSQRQEKLLSLSNVNGIEIPAKELREMYNTFVSKGMHGLCFSL